MGTAMAAVALEPAVAADLLRPMVNESYPNHLTLTMLCGCLTGNCTPPMKETATETATEAAAPERAVALGRGRPPTENESSADGPAAKGGRKMALCSFI